MYLCNNMTMMLDEIIWTSYFLFEPFYTWYFCVHLRNIETFCLKSTVRNKTVSSGLEFNSEMVYVAFKHNYCGIPGYQEVGDSSNLMWLF